MCAFEEYAVGTDLFEEKDLYHCLNRQLLPKTDVPEGKLVDPDEVCVFSISGTFRKSSASNGI